MGKKVYIFGAGSSVHVGGPLNKDWIQTIKANKENRKHSLALNFLNSLPGFDNLEALLSLVDLSIIEQHNYLPVSASIGYLETVRREIIDCIVNVANEITKKCKTDKLIKNFFEKTGLQADDTVINFNYDLAVDWGLYETKLWNPYKDHGENSQRCGYGFGIGSLNGLLEPSALAVQPSKIKYLKLHGSINWLWMENSHLDLSWNFPDPNNVPTPNTVSAATPQNYIITPSFIKMFEEMPLRMLWLYASNSIAEASEIYVVGYSFLKADILARQLLLNVNPDKMKKIIIIDPLGNLACSEADKETDKRIDIDSMLPWQKDRGFWDKKITVEKKTLEQYANGL